MNGEGLIKRCRARGMAYMECYNALTVYEPAPGSIDDSAVDREARTHVQDRLYASAQRYLRQADTLERQAVIDRNRGAGVTFV